MTDILRADGEPVGSLGLGGTPDIRPAWVDAAYRRGVDYFFCYTHRFSGMLEGMAHLCRAHRDRIFVAVGDEDRSPGGLQRSLDAYARTLGADVIDAFFVEYVSPDDDPERVSEALGVVAAWKTEGRVRLVGASAHDRDIAVRLIESGRVDLLMHRYNMAHRRSEARVLPAALEGGVPVVAFTCTRWGSLLKGHARWKGPAPTAAECYRFALSHPAVRLALNAPGSARETEENTAVLETAAMSEAEREAWSGYGDLVYGDGTDAFETRWP